LPFSKNENGCKDAPEYEKPVFSNKNRKRKVQMTGSPYRKTKRLLIQVLKYDAIGCKEEMLMHRI